MDLDDSELYWTKVQKGLKKVTQEDLDKLEEKYFLLQMQDNWDAADYRYADQLRANIKKCKELLS